MGSGRQLLPTGTVGIPKAAVGCEPIPNNVSSPKASAVQQELLSVSHTMACSAGSAGCQRIPPRFNSLPWER